ncbi:hypothetical protein EI94DRAFT_1721294 [Lactarius quietus]|nr:hypothetical protein EI94DRAFT_1721294 [Lactarius quietus]
MPAQSPTTRKRGYRHDYIHGADAVFIVERTLYRVHRFFFIRDSSWFEDRLPYPQPPGDTGEGTENNPLVLEDVSKTDFERLLWVFYNPKYSLYDASIKEWTSILKLAHRWDLIEVKELAVRGLESHHDQISALQKVVLYQTYDVDRKHLQAAFTDLTVRDDSITIEEGRLLGLDTCVQLARAREFARALSFSGKRVANPRIPVSLAEDELHTLINSVFRLSSPGATSEQTTQMPTGSGTPTNAWDTSQTGSTPTNSGSSASNPPQGTGTHANATINSKSTTNGPPNGHVNGANNSNTRGQAGGRK